MFRFFRLAALGSLLTGILATNASAVPILTQCSSTISSVFRTDIQQRGIGFTGFQNLPGALALVNVPAGENRCIIVTFSALTQCFIGSIPSCTFRATVNGIAMNPQLTVSMFAGPHDGRKPHGFQWIRRVGPGTHSVLIQWNAPNSQMLVQGWTMRVEVTNTTIQDDE